eukprot:TRINITY_DN1816_c0_g1_i1.p1 TRINITY_DN1816_c0_g1~~TRINITY_DN1816_c0_g1_i1.p1  ORF type:complete len:368 (+),score=64.99 TRINITY_DN1816_c0_g1_i1:163-1104(+)
MGKHLQKTYKDMQSCLDSMRALTGATNTVADDLLRVYDQQARTYNAVTTFKSVQEELDTNIRASVDAIFVERVLGPVGELLALFPEVKKRCEARGKLLLDYDYYRNKVHKLKEKPSSDPTVLPRKEKKLSASKDAYTSLNQELINEFTAFESRRNELLNQPFLALMGCTWMYMTGCVSHMKGLGPFLQYSDFIDHGELNALTGQGGSRPGDDLFRSPNFSELHDMLNPQQAGGGDEDGVPSHTRTGSTSSGMAAASHEETTMGETASSFHQMSLNVGGDNGARAEALFKFEAREDNEVRVYVCVYCMIRVPYS